MEWSLRAFESATFDRFFREAATRKSAIALHGLGLFFERCLSRRQTRDWDTERRATDVVQSDAMTEFDAVRITTVFAANAQLDVRAGGLAFFDGDLHELADAGLVN